MQTLEHLRWDDLRVLLVLYRVGSLKRAAAELRVNVSTASRRIDALEAALGVRLFDRMPDGTHPTAAAEDLVGFAETMEHAAHGMMRGVQQLEAEVEGRVTLTAPPGVVDHFLAPALVELADRHPRLQITIISSVGYADLTRREADIALRIRRPEAGDLVSKRIASAPYILVAAPQHAAALGRLRDVNATRWVTWGDELAGLPDRAFVDAHVDPNRVMLRCNGMSALLGAVRGGLGVMLAPPIYAELHGLAKVECTAKLAKQLRAIPHGALWLVGHRALRDVPRVAAVWSWLAEHFAAK